jgi:hypothetical protein
MSIEVRAPELYALADTLRRSSRIAEEVAARLRDTPDVGGGLNGAVEGFLDSHRTAGRALAGELEWLGATVAAVADSWLGLDRDLLADGGRVGLR